MLFLLFVFNVCPGTLSIYLCYRTNEERLAQFGDSLSSRNKIYRAKRIDVNVKVNFLAYAVEVLGTLVVVMLSVLRPPTFLYLGVLVWYGNVIPSCYLINSIDTKKFIMEQGWLAALSELYKKKKPKEVPSSKAKSESNHNKSKGDANNGATEVDDSIEHQNEASNTNASKSYSRENIAMQNLKSRDCRNCSNCKIKKRGVSNGYTNNENHQQPQFSQNYPTSDKNSKCNQEENLVENKKVLSIQKGVVQEIPHENNKKLNHFFQHQEIKAKLSETNKKSRTLPLTSKKGSNAIIEEVISPQILLPNQPDYS